MHGLQERLAEAAALAQQAADVHKTVAELAGYVHEGGQKMSKVLQLLVKMCTRTGIGTAVSAG